MKVSDKIARETLGLFEYSKEVVKNNLISANKSGNIPPHLNETQLNGVLSLIDSSLSQGYHRGITSFQKIVESTIASFVEATSADFNKKKK